MKCIVKYKSNMLFLLLLQAFLGAADASIANFYLTTKQGVYDLKQTTPNQFDSNSCFKFIIHGYTESANKTHYVRMAETYLSSNINCNIVRVDYSELQNASGLYPYWVYKVPSVASYIGDFLIKLMQIYQIKPENIHLIGHSLGGQVSGYVARRVFNQTGRKVGRISGLDPAAPLFEFRSDAEKLTANDADFVDIIHTDGGVSGYLAPYGNVDFYPNGGTRSQPGCDFTMEMLFTNITHIGDAIINYCSHHKSYEFFTASILNDYYGYKCDSWYSYTHGYCSNNERILFGEKTPSNVKGRYYLTLD